MRDVLLLLALGLQSLCSLASFSIEAQSWELSRNFEKCENNPFRGMVGSPNWGINTDFPISLEFFYLALNDVVVAENTYNWTKLENKLQDAASRNHHAILRFWIDYPTKSTGVPQYLVDGGLHFDQYDEHGGGLSPNYSDPNLQTCVLDFVAALQSAYDGDWRIGVLQLGLLGFWGEWHVYPHSDWQWSDAFGGQLVHAFASFTQTTLNKRLPSAATEAYATQSSAQFGFHDDSFAYSTLGDVDWFFYSHLQEFAAENQSELVMFGGEVYPELQTEVFADSYETDTFAQNFSSCMFSVGPSYMLFSALFSNDDVISDDSFKARALWNARRLGYALTVDSVSLDPVSSDEFSLTVDITNEGSAPFYGWMSVTLELLDNETGAVLLENGGQFDSPLSGASTTLTYAFSTENAEASALNNADLKLQLQAQNQFVENIPVFCNEEIDSASQSLLIYSALKLEDDGNDNAAFDMKARLSLMISCFGWLLSTLLL